jgi:hypothetical protein
MVTARTRRHCMYPEITRPEVEAIIHQRLQSGGFKAAEDVILQALQASPPKPARMPQPDAPPAKSIEELFAPLPHPARI